MMFSEDPLPPFSFEPLSPSPKEIIVSDSESDSLKDPHQRSAKRRRVEDIARQYVAGQPIYILSASLKGPFNGSWRNPWSKPSRAAASGSKASHLEHTRSKNIKIKPRSTPRRGAKGGHYPTISDATPKSLDKNESRSDLVAVKDERDEQYGRGAEAGQATRQYEHDCTHEPTRWEDDYNNMEMDYQRPSNTITNNGFLKAEEKADKNKDGKISSTGIWLRRAEGSTCSRLHTQEDTASLSNEMFHTPSKRTSSKRKDTYPLNTSHQNPRIGTDSRSERDRDEFMALDDPLEPTSEMGAGPSKLASPRETSDCKEHSRCTVLLPTQEEGTGLVIKLTDLVGASAETIQSWMRAKELSILAASQGSQSASFRQSKSPAAARLSQPPIEAIEDEHSASQPAFTARASLVSDDSKDNGLERLSHSQPDPFKSISFEPNSATASFPARSSPATAMRKSYRVVSPSTELPGFKYWRAKSATAQKSPLQNAGTGQRANFSRGSGGAEPPSPEESDRALTKEYGTVGLNKKANNRDRAKQDAMSTGIHSMDVVTSTMKTPSQASPAWLNSRATKSERSSASKLRKHFISSTSTDQPEVEANTVHKNTGTARIPSNQAPMESTTPAGDLKYGGMVDATMKEDASETGSPEVAEPSLSTQAAFVDMQRRFQAEIETPAQQKLITSAAPQPTGNQRKQRVETPNRKATSSSPLFVERTRGPSGDNAIPGRVSPEKEFISTQMLLDAASPFEISTIVEEQRIPASVDLDVEDPERTQKSSRMASKNTSPETPASAWQQGQHPAAGRADGRSQSKSAIKKDHVTVSPRNTMSQSTCMGEGDAVDLNTTIGEMMGSILQGWDVETELKKSAASEGSKRTGQSAGRRRAS